MRRKTVYSFIKDIDTDPLARAINNSPLPFHFRRSHTLGFLRKGKWLLAPLFGAFAVGSYMMYRGIKSLGEVNTEFDMQHMDTPHENGEAKQNGSAEKKDELDAVQRASQDSFPASDPPSFTSGSDDQVKKAEDL